MTISINSIEFDLLKNSSIGGRIKFLRKKLMDRVTTVPYTSNSISKRTGIAVQTLSSIERGDSKKPSFSVINALAKDFSVPLDVFTDEYYEGEEKLFSLGKPVDIVPDAIDLDFDIDDGDILSFGDKEYIVGEAEVLSRSRNISINVSEELPNGTQKNLYSYDKRYRESELVQLLSQIIQTVELSNINLSYNEWIVALERSPLGEANDIVLRRYDELPNMTIKWGNY